MTNLYAVGNWFEYDQAARRARRAAILRLVAFGLAGIPAAGLILLVAWVTA